MVFELFFYCVTVQTKQRHLPKGSAIIEVIVCVHTVHVYAYWHKIHCICA